MRKVTKGFTLLELLVVILIIGILAAVALPQYRKAVWKSRTTQLYALVQSVYEAQEAYFLANGTYANKFSELDVDLDAWSERDKSWLTADADGSRANENFTIVLGHGSNTISINGMFRKGPYKLSGLRIRLTGSNPSVLKKILCLEHTQQCPKCCQKIFSVRDGDISSSDTAWTEYRLP